MIHVITVNMKLYRAAIIDKDFTMDEWDINRYIYHLISQTQKKSSMYVSDIFKLL